MRTVHLSHHPGERHLLILVVMTTVGWLGFAGCATVPSQQPRPVQEALLGKSVSQILACAGEPLAEAQEGDTRVLTYYMEAPMLEESFMGSKGSRSAPHHGCKATVKLKDDRVTQVQYQSVPRGYFADDHCDEIFETCVQ